MERAQPGPTHSELPAAQTALDEALQAARRIGADPGMVLFGGGNTSVKVRESGREVLYVKGSGADLAHVTARNYAPLDLEGVRGLLGQALDDNRAMYAALAAHALSAQAPRPSIETLMHAGIPATHVIHTHAAAVLAIANTVRAATHLEAALGDIAPVAPYRHSGVELARACVDAWRGADPRKARGLVLAHHGALSVGRDAGEALEGMFALRDRAERYLDANGAPRWDDNASVRAAAPADAAIGIARLRREASRVAGRKLIGTVRDGGLFGAFIRRPDVAAVTAHGPSTPGHAIYTKRIPQIGRDVAAFAAAYRAYLGGADNVDCAPRVVLDPGFGMLAFGVTKRHADMAAAVFMHDCAIMARASAIDQYATIPATLLRAAETEYAGFERRVAREMPRAGEIHVLDRACARADAIGNLLASGAAVAALDEDAAVTSLFDSPAYLGLVLRKPRSASPLVASIIGCFGGIDHADVAPGLLEQFIPYLEIAHA